MERGESKGNPTGSTHFSTPEEMPAGTSSRPLTFRQEKSDNDFNEISEEDPEQENQKAKGTHNAIEIVNPNLVKPKSMKSQDADHCITEVQSYCEKSDGECHRRYTIGYAILEKKKISFMQDSLICLARDRGIILVPIDISLPLTEQGPFDFIVQKIYGDEWKSRIKEYSQKYPDVPIIDPPEMVEKLRDRISMLDVVNQIDVSQEKETFGIPKQVVVYDQKGLSDDISDALNILSFPIIAKPLAASGTDASHKMELVFHRDGLLKLKPPIVLQEFVNHGGVIFKVYVAGDHVNCVKRKSLPDISEEKLKRCEGSVQFSLISNMSMKDHKAEEGKYYEKMHLEDAVMPPISFVTDIARGLRRAMGLNLFNFDVIRDAKVGNHYVVVDINYFPGYAKMPSYETVLTDFFCDIVRKYTKQDGKLDSVVH